MGIIICDGHHAQDDTSHWKCELASTVTNGCREAAVIGHVNSGIGLCAKHLYLLKELKIQEVFFPTGLDTTVCNRVRLFIDALNRGERTKS